MSLENVAPAANEPAPVEKIETAPAAVESTEAEHTPDNDPDGNAEEVDSEAQTSEPEWAEIEIDGKKYKVEAAAKDGYLRQSDYTRKTQEVAEAKRALEAEREGFTKQTEAQKAHFQIATKLASLDEQLAPYARMTAQDWMNLHASDPVLYEQHRINRDSIKEQRDAVARDFSQKEMERQGNEQRATAKRVVDAYTAIERHVPAWKPNSEFETKIFSYGNAQGYKTDVLAQAIIQEPLFARDLARLQAYDEAAKKQKTQATFQKAQEAQPVTRVGGNSGAAARRTTDSSGDALSTAEWIKRESARVAAKNKR